MARCSECRRIRSSNRYTQLSRRVVAEEPICWLQLDGCTHRSTSMDHIVPLHTDHSMGLVRSNCRGACHNCNTWRARRTLRQTAILRTRKRPTVGRRPAPRPALRPALRWFGTMLDQGKHCIYQPDWCTPISVGHKRIDQHHIHHHVGVLPAASTILRHTKGSWAQQGWGSPNLVQHSGFGSRHLRQRPPLRPVVLRWVATILHHTKPSGTQHNWSTPNHVQHKRSGHQHPYPAGVHRSTKHPLHKTKQSLRANRNRYLVTKHPLRAILAISMRIDSISAKMSSCGPIPCGGMKRANYA